MLFRISTLVIIDMASRERFSRRFCTPRPLQRPHVPALQSSADKNVLDDDDFFLLILLTTVSGKLPFDLVLGGDIIKYNKEVFR